VAHLFSLDLIYSHSRMNIHINYKGRTIATFYYVNPLAQVDRIKSLIKTVPEFQDTLRDNQVLKLGKTILGAGTLSSWGIVSNSTINFGEYSL
jgi:hypothetical protein